MLHGVQKMQLTSASVLEALNDYVSKHMAATTPITVKSWKAVEPQGYGQTDRVIDIEFEQSKPGEKGA